ncbi:MAG: Asr1405/Asl0597 family protein [Phormidesmis sp.]
MDKSTPATSTAATSTPATSTPATPARSTLGPVVEVPRVDRWSINHRLQELNIPCACPADGTLRVNVNDAVALLLVNSVVRRFKAPRQAGVDWLERCWGTQVACPTVSHSPVACPIVSRTTVSHTASSHTTVS